MARRNAKNSKDQPLFDQPRPIRLEFLGWSRPILHSARDYLFDRYRRGSEWNLDRMLVVLPGSLAGRTLQTLLAEQAAQQKVVLRPPEILTLGKLPEKLYQAKLPFATELDQIMAWTHVLRNMDLADLRPLLFEVPNVDELIAWMDLGRILGTLHRELASDLLDFSNVAERLVGTAEEARWRVLATLQRRYLDILHEAGLWDIQTARRFALEHNEVQATDHEIMLIGTVDLNRAQRRFLSAVASQVTSLVGAPTSFAPGFDADGTLRSDFWQGLEIPIDDESMHVRSTVRDAADELALQLARLGSSRSTSQITVGVPDPSLIPAFQESLARAGVSLRYGPGVAIHATQPMKLLTLIQNYLREGEIEAFHNLVRETTIDQWLRTHIELPDDYLASIDEYLNTTLLRSVRVPVFPDARRGKREFESVIAALRALFEPLQSGKRTMSDWVDPFRNMFRELYASFPVDIESEEGHAVQRACTEINSAIEQWIHTPAILNKEIELRDAFAWLHQLLEGAQIPPLRDRNAIEMIGWLELALDDAPVLMLSGLHDGVIPESVNSDAFLPNRLRSELGLIDNARRYARDAYVMLVILNTREQVELILNRMNSDGDPLTPSRLLLSVPTPQLASRVLKLLNESQRIQTKVVTWVPRIGQSEISIPQPSKQVSVADMAVTDFKKYADCPYRFYLNRVLKLRAVKHLPLELDGGAFGDLVHKVLEDFFEAPVADSIYEDTITDWLISRLEQESQNRFGLTPPPAVVVQMEQAKTRLRQFAPLHAEKMRSGWKMVEAEFTVDREHAIDFPLDKDRFIKLHGRIDRIDWHEADDRWAVWDYKTGDSSGNPRAIHIKSGKWADWQLPLYGVLIDEAKGVSSDKASFGYILLPRNIAETEFICADFTAQELDAAVDSARELASQVVDGVFWPPNNRSMLEYDDYWAITQRTVVRKWAPDRRSDPPELSICEQPLLPDVRPRVSTEHPSRLLVEPVSIEGEPPSEWFQPRMIMASAGTGKTYRLASRAIQLLFSDQSLETVLATTFTRKAAGEILHRILGWLAQACESDDAFVQLERILAPLSITREAVRYQLARLCSQLHRFRVSTLDSFYSQLARSFSLELKLPPGWTLIDPVQEEQLRRDAVTRLFEVVEQSELRSLISQLSKGEAVRSIRSQIDDVVSKGYQLYCRASDKKVWTLFQVPSGPGEDAVRSALEIAQQTTLGTTRADTARDKSLQWFQIKDWEGFLTETLVLNAHEDKPTFSRREIPSELVGALRTLAKHAIAGFLASRRAQNEAAFDLLHRYHKELVALKQQRRIVTFEDVAQKLAGWMSESVEKPDSSDSPEASMSSIAHRLDCSIDHLLLDEFQDTSPEQWKILKPFAEAITGVVDDPSRSTSFFCVGDTKQAIYAWRGGVSEIFESVGEEVRNVQTEHLTYSRRSSPIIIQFVNDVFERLAYHPNFLGDESKSELKGPHPVIDAWVKKYFQLHSTAKDTLPGYVEIRNAPSPESKDGSDSDGKEPLMEAITEKVASLHAQSPRVSIGILTRTNAEVGKLITMLRERGVEASQEGGNELIDTSAVLVIRSAMQLADHPGDSLAHFHVVQSPLGSYWSEEIRSSPARLSNALRRLLDLRGLGNAVSSLAEQLAPFCNARDQERLKQLVEEAFRFMGFRSRGLHDFIEFLDTHRVSLPSESPVRVMTIHQAKGLEFDAVFLPSLGQSIVSKPAEYLVMRASPTAGPTGIIRHMARDLQRYLDLPWQLAFKEAAERQLGEALCLFYVALTRARQAVYMITTPQKSVGRHWGSVLHTLFGTEEVSNQPDALLHQLGDPEWFAAKGELSESQESPITAEVTSQESQVEKLVRIRLAASDSRESEKWVAPSALKEEREEAPSLSEVWQPDMSQGVVIGKLVHRWLEEIHDWIEAGTPSKKRLLEIAKSALTQDELSQIRIADWVDRFGTYLEAPEVRGLMSYSHYSDWHQPRTIRLEVTRERRLLQQLDRDLVRGVIDRCVLGYDGDRVVRADVIDFKVDQYPESQPVDAWINERTAVHAPQLQLYGTVLRQQYGLRPEQIQLTLVMLSVGRVIPVPLISSTQST
jgi:ATP-dependent exoDNAse (exonuclease V) beta subunit